MHEWIKWRFVVEKMKVVKKILAGVMVVATVALSSKVTGLVTDNRGAVAEAAGRVALQHNNMDVGAWWATVHRIAKSQT